MQTTEKEKTRYSDEELKMFKGLLLGKLKIAKEELHFLQGSVGIEEDRKDSISDGAGTLQKESNNQLAKRQQKFIEQLEAALVRIETKSYGICRETGKLIPEGRLRAVPHTTLCYEAKMAAA